MGIVKLERGGRMSMLVQAMVDSNSGQYGPEKKLTGVVGADTDAAFFVKTDVLERQATRLGYTVAGLLGCQVDFTKTADKGYLNIEKITPGAHAVGDQVAHEQAVVQQVVRAGAVAATARPVRQPVTRQSMVLAYQESLEDACVALSSHFGSAEDPPPEVVTSVATTLFIQRHREGI